MTTNQPDRLDRMETLLERFIDASVADHAASNERMTRLEQTMERQNRESNERMERLSEKTDARFNQLLTEADANRQVTFAMLEQMTTLQEENKQILQYLFGQQRGNGSSDQPQA